MKRNNFSIFIKNNYRENNRCEIWRQVKDSLFLQKITAAKITVAKFEVYYEILQQGKRAATIGGNKRSCFLQSFPDDDSDREKKDWKNQTDDEEL